MLSQNWTGIYNRKRPFSESEITVVQLFATRWPGSERSHIAKTALFVMINTVQESIIGKGISASLLLKVVYLFPTKWFLGLHGNDSNLNILNHTDKISLIEKVVCLFATMWRLCCHDILDREIILTIG